LIVIAGLVLSAAAAIIFGKQTEDLFELAGRIYHAGGG
jgi:hypothetical protein